MTNREYLAALSNEELAEFLGLNSSCKLCTYYNKQDCMKIGCVCIEGTLQWLNAERGKE